MQVRTQDAIDFYKHKLEHYAVKRAELNTKYDLATEEYENSFFPKLFNWKYEDSCEGDKSWFSGNWGFADLDLYEDQTTARLNQCIYYSKLDHFMIEFEGNSDQFFKWAKENNKPY